MADLSELLKVIEPFLDVNGGLKLRGVPVILERASQFSMNLPPKCLTLQILQYTPENVLNELCSKGLWDVLWRWLQEAKKTDNMPFLSEILLAYQSAPVDVEMMKLNDAPKTINCIAKLSASGVSALARSIVKKWKVIIRTSTDDRPSKRKLSDEDADQEVPKKALLRSEDLSARKVIGKVEKISKNDEPKDLSSFRIPKLSKIADISTGGPPDLKCGIEKKQGNQIKESSAFIDMLTTASSREQPIRKKKKLSNKKVLPAEPVHHVTPDASDTDKTKCVDFHQSRKKCVHWPDDSELLTICEFEMDETERVNVNRLTIEELKRQEHQQEKERFSAKHLSIAYPIERDTNRRWHPPPVLDGLCNLSEKGSKSQEVAVQAEREKSLLRALFFNKEYIPDSAAEPEEVEAVDVSKPKLIPLSEVAPVNPEPSKVSGKNLLISRNSNGQTQISLRPDVANLLKTIASSRKRGESTVVTSEDSEVSPSSQTISSTAAPTDKEDETKAHIWELLASHYPNVKLESLNPERVKDLLEPLKRQLIERGMCDTEYLSPPTFVRPSCPADAHRPRLYRPSVPMRMHYPSRGLVPHSGFPLSDRASYQPVYMDNGLPVHSWFGLPMRPTRPSAASHPRENFATDQPDAEKVNGSPNAT